jgi:hypothetical protein
MADHKITLESIIHDANKVGDFKMDDDGRVTGRFKDKEAMDAFMNGNLEFYWCTNSVAIAYNAEHDYVIIARASGGAGASTAVSFIIHGLHDWLDLMIKMHNWREYPSEEKLKAVTEKLRAYQNDAELVRLGLYAMFGRSARIIGRPD